MHSCRIQPRFLEDLGMPFFRPKTWVWLEGLLWTCHSCNFLFFFFFCKYINSKNFCMYSQASGISETNAMCDNCYQ